MSLASLTVGSFLDEVAARTAAPGGGAVAALTAASAAGLVAMAARFSDAAEVAGVADGLRERLTALADADVAAYSEVLAARGDSGRRAAAMRVAVEVPREIAALAGEVAGLARGLVEGGNRRLVGDARVGELVAEAAGRAASVLVEINTASS